VETGRSRSQAAKRRGDAQPIPGNLETCQRWLEASPPDVFQHHDSPTGDIPAHIPTGTRHTRRPCSAPDQLAIVSVMCARDGQAGIGR
jgi:hypothetical protein